jgi:trans-feruloyl-CoA hydratase/vanillin synthase
MSDTNVPGGKNVLVEFDERIAWVSINRPDKRNAMSVDLAYEMLEVLEALEVDDRCGVLVLTGVGESFSAGMDLKDYFRATDGLPAIERARVYRINAMWQWRFLAPYPKPTIAMVNGWCFGGAFTPLVSCDLAIAAEDAVFGLSEINWGIIPAGVVTKAVAMTMNQRDALYYIMTGETFDGKRAKEMGLVNDAVPKERLRERTRHLAMTLLEKNPTVLRQAKAAYKAIREGMSWDVAADYLSAKMDQTSLQDTERGRETGLKQFLDEKSFRPGLEPYRRKP